MYTFQICTCVREASQAIYFFYLNERRMREEKAINMDAIQCKLANLMWFNLSFLMLFIPSSSISSDNIYSIHACELIRNITFWWMVSCIIWLCCVPISNYVSFKCWCMNEFTIIFIRTDKTRRINMGEWRLELLCLNT